MRPAATRGAPADAVGHEPKVVLVLVGGVPRLVQELHLGGDDGRPIRAPLRELADVKRDARVAPAQPDPALGLVQEELALVVVRLPRLGRAAARRPEEDLVDREVEPLVRTPRNPAANRLVCVPVPVVLVEGGLMVAEDAHLQVLVRRG